LTITRGDTQAIARHHHSLCIIENQRDSDDEFALDNVRRFGYVPVLFLLVGKWGGK